MASEMTERAVGSRLRGSLAKSARSAVNHDRPLKWPAAMRSRSTARSSANGSARATPTASKPTACAYSLMRLVRSRSAGMACPLRPFYQRRSRAATPIPGLLSRLGLSRAARQPASPKGVSAWPTSGPNPCAQGLEAQQSQLEGVARVHRFRVIFKAAILEPLKRIAPSAAVAVAFHDNLRDRRTQDHGAIVLPRVAEDASGEPVPRARDIQARGRGRERRDAREPAACRQPLPQGCQHHPPVDQFQKRAVGILHEVSVLDERLRLRVAKRVNAPVAQPEGKEGVYQVMVRRGDIARTRTRSGGGGPLPFSTHNGGAGAGGQYAPAPLIEEESGSRPVIDGHRIRSPAA